MPHVYLQLCISTNNNKIHRFLFINPDQLSKIKKDLTLNEYPKLLHYESATKIVREVNGFKNFLWKIVLFGFLGLGLLIVSIFLVTHL
ncbi:hypothetical protein FJZ48_02010 [Candidatus Uhrbacteria bacterium]|nr:hypothetical protein [Candidatus Uhrbacteria bacterium]